MRVRGWPAWPAWARLAVAGPEAYDGDTQLCLDSLMAEGGRGPAVNVPDPTVEVPVKKIETRPKVPMPREPSDGEAIEWPDIQSEVT